MNIAMYQEQFLSKSDFGSLRLGGNWKLELLATFFSKQNNVIIEGNVATH